MKKLLVLLLLIPIFCSAQYLKTPGKYNWLDSLMMSRYKNNLAGDSVLTTDTSGKLKLKKITSGGGGSAAGNYGNLQINRNGFDAPGNDSLNYTSSKLSVKGHYSATGNIYLPNSTSAVGSLYLNNLRWLGNWGDVSSHSNVNAGIGAGSDTSLYGNVVFGWLAGQRNNGFDNVIMGEQAAINMRGYDGIEGSSRNIIIGDHAAGAATGSKMNIYIGQESGYNSTDSCIHNGGLGKSALAALRAGVGNTALGFSVLSSGTGFRGDWNSIFGADALSSPTSGNNNTAGGAYALAGSTTASNNTALGYNAANILTTGSQNTFLGGYAGPNITTGDYNVIIGWLGGGTDANGSNKLIIQADASGSLTHLIDGDFANQKLGINSTLSGLAANANNFQVNGTSYFSGNTGIGITPTAKFHLSGTAKFDLGSDATGDIFYRNSSGFFTRLGVGTTSQHLLGGTIPHWGDTSVASGGGGTPGGSNTQVQFNNSSAFGGSANFTWNGSRMGAIAATIGSTSTPNGTSPLTIDAASTNTTYLLQMGKNGNPAYFRIDKDGNISDIGGGPARIQSVGGVPYFPDGFSSLYWPSASDPNVLIKGNVSSALPFGVDLSASFTNGQTGFFVRGSQAASPGPSFTIYDAFFNGLSGFDGYGKLGIGNVAATEKLDVTGNVKFSGALMPNNTAGTSGQVLTTAGAGVPPIWNTLAGVSNYQHSIFAPTTGGTVNLVNKQYNIINPAGTLVALTVNLPSSPANNDVVFIKFTQSVTTVTYANGTVVDGVTAPTAGGLTVLVYDSGTTSWY